MTAEPSTVAQPSTWPQASVRRPPTSSTAAPNRGSAISSQVAEKIPVASPICAVPISFIESSSTDPGSVLQEVGIVDGCRASGPEDGHDYREPDDHLCRGDDHDEERDDLPVQISITP